MGTDDDSAERAGSTRRPVRQTLAHTLPGLRARRELSVRALSGRLAALGLSLLPSGITKIEQGARGVDVDELVALAVALNVRPARLLLPDAYSADVQADLTPTLSVRSDSAWRWAEGREALDLGQGDREMLDHQVAYLREAPARLQASTWQPLVRVATEALLFAEYVVHAQTEQERERARQLLLSDLDLLRAELDRVRWDRG